MVCVAGVHCSILVSSGMHTTAGSTARTSTARTTSGQPASGSEDLTVLHLSCVLQGAAQAALAAYMLQLDGFTGISLYTFGMPQVG